MAANGRRPRSRYSPPGPVSGNLARKLDSRELERRLESSGQLDFDQQYHRRQESRAELRARQRAKAKAAVRPAQKVSAAAVLGFGCVALLVMAVLMCYVRINAISRSIVSMKNQISELEVEQVALLTEYERLFDLSTVKEAAEAAGMTQPSESQIYYVDLPGEDQAGAYGGESTGVLERIFTSAGQGICAAVEYFQR